MFVNNLEIFEVCCDFQDVEFDQSNKKKFDDFEIFPRTLRGIKLNCQSGDK